MRAEYEQLRQNRQEHRGSSMARLRLAAAMVRRPEDYCALLSSVEEELRADRRELKRMEELPLHITQPGQPPARGLPDHMRRWHGLLQDGEAKLAALQRSMRELKGTTNLMLDDESRRLGLLNRAGYGHGLEPLNDNFM